MLSNIFFPSVLYYDNLACLAYFPNYVVVARHSYGYARSSAHLENILAIPNINDTVHYYMNISDKVNI
ncbi:hypothetical protein MASR2M70_13700 [Bacillota bacterium]